MHNPWPVRLHSGSKNQDGFLETVIGVPTAEPTLAGYDIQRTVRFGRRAWKGRHYPSGRAHTGLPQVGHFYLFVKAGFILNHQLDDLPETATFIQLHISYKGGHSVDDVRGNLCLNDASADRLVSNPPREVRTIRDR